MRRSSFAARPGCPTGLALVLDGTIDRRNNASEDAERLERIIVPAESDTMRTASRVKPHLSM